MQGTRYSYLSKDKTTATARPVSEKARSFPTPPRRLLGRNALAPALVACTLFFQCGCSAAPSGPPAPPASANNSVSAASKGSAEATPAAGSQEKAKPVLSSEEISRNPSSPPSAKAIASYLAVKACPEICSKLFCYCGCDVTDEHVSLLDCFTSDHGVDCYVCQDEALVALQMKKKGKTLPEIQKVIDQAYKHEYPFDEMSPAYKKYHAAKLWKDTSNPLDKGGSQGSASSTKDNNASTTGDAKGIKSASGAVNAKSSTKGSCCGGKTKAK